MDAFASGVNVPERARQALGSEESGLREVDLDFRLRESDDVSVSEGVWVNEGMRMNEGVRVNDGV